MAKARYHYRHDRRARRLVARVHTITRPKTRQIHTREHGHELSKGKGAGSATDEALQRISSQVHQIAQRGGCQYTKCLRDTYSVGERASTRKSCPRHAERLGPAGHTRNHRFPEDYHTTSRLRIEGSWYTTNRRTENIRTDALQRLPPGQEHAPRVRH